MTQSPSTSASRPRWAAFLIMQLVLLLIAGAATWTDSRWLRRSPSYEKTVIRMWGQRIPIRTETLPRKDSSAFASS